MSAKKKILFAVLNWGLGHATRSLPIIRYLISSGHDLVIASDGIPLEFLKGELPSASFEELSGYNIDYSDTRLLVGMIRQGPKIVKAIKKEHAQTRQIVAKHKIDLIFSDSRFGCYHAKLNSFLIGHTLQVPTSDPVTSFAANKTLRRWINRFDTCLVPDIPAPGNLSGYLSDANLNIPKKYIGWLSDLDYEDSVSKYDLTVVLSGPEPQRSTLEKLVLDQLKSLEGQYLVIGGTTDVETPQELPQHITYISIADRKSMKQYINASHAVLSRSGYSSLMDWLRLGKSMIIVPTPGQPEQIYLAEILKQRKMAIAQRQDQLNIKAAIMGLSQLSETQNDTSQYEMFESVVDTLISRPLFS